ncbi:MAG: transcriptional repressor [Dehalococcoidia bacterium]|nr:transcriptional repressor [Dehalococcoidia bacterium]
MVESSKGRGNARRILNSSSQRVTAQRALLLELLRHSSRHVDADDLYRRARKKNSRISLSTVYRNLQLFKKLGLIEEHHFDEEHHHYEVKSGTEHQHLLCTSCGKVVEFACPVSWKLRRDIGKQYDFDITGVEVRMTGLCPSCRSKENKTIPDRS